MGHGERRETRLYHPLGTLVRMELAEVHELVVTVAGVQPSCLDRDHLAPRWRRGPGCRPGWTGATCSAAHRPTWPPSPSKLSPRRPAARCVTPGGCWTGLAPPAMPPLGDALPPGGVGRMSMSSDGRDGNWNPTNGPA